jgi:hypothetical protein
MAQQVEVLLIDDRDGSGGDGTVRVGLSGSGCEIGGTAGHARALYEVWRAVAAARQAGRRRQAAGTG